MIVIIVSVIIILFLLVCVFVMHTMLVRVAELAEDQKKVIEAYRELDNTWIFNLQNGRGVKEYFLANRFRNIAILGYNSYTYLLFEELELADAGFKAVCVDDEHSVGLTPFPGLEFIGCSEFLNDLSKYDIIVDVEACGDKIEPSEMRNKIPKDKGCKIVSISDLAYFTSEL